MLVSLKKQSIVEPGVSPRHVNAYDKFMSGHDTLQLADRYRVSEAVMLFWISRERSRRHELPSPYASRP